jgi:2',3'-cyclic-nucleotide 2'-phosphodiesterase (5'-nucleotidase family)
MDLRFRRCFHSLLFLLSLAAFTVVAQPKTFTILHTNDMHAGFQPHEAMWVKSTRRPLVGGFTELSYIIDSVRRQSAISFLMDAGDVMTGTPITERVYQGASGGALFEMMNLMGYDVWCPGNHDLDISQDNLKALARIARFPMVCANLVDDHGDFPMGNIPYAIITRKSVSIGVVGLISQELSSLVNQNNLVGLRVLDPAATLQRYADELRDSVDIVIALTHEGVQEDSALATQVHGIPVIIGGHSHTRITHPRVVQGVIIVQAGSNAENLGVLELTVDRGAVIDYAGSLVPLRNGGRRPESRVSELVDSMKLEIDKEYSEVIGNLSSEWVRGNGQSCIGTFIAEAQRKAASADVAFMNNYGIRRDLPAGPVTKKALFEVLPFRNVLVAFQLTGAQLRTILTYNIEKHPAIQVAGLDARWRRGQDGKVQWVSIDVDGTPLEDSKIYRCAASDYLVGESKRYLGLEISNPSYLRQLVFDTVLQEFHRAKTVGAKVLYSIERVE